MTIDTTTLSQTPATGPTPEPIFQRTAILRLPRSPKVIAGLVILAVFGVVAIIGRWIAPYSPNATDTQNWVQRVLVPGTGEGTPFPANYYPLPLPPSAAHWLGTSVFAQDVFSQLLASTQATLFVGLLAASIATVLSVVIGVSAGYFGGGTDEGLSLLSNVFLAIPALPLLIVLADYVPRAGSSILLVAAIIAVTTWAYTSRTLRAQTLSLRNRDFVEAARVSGEGRLRIILVEVLPNLIPIVAASFLFTTLTAMYAYVAIAFLGLAGAPTGSPAGLWNYPAFAWPSSAPAWRCSTSASTSSSIPGFERRGFRAVRPSRRASRRGRHWASRRSWAIDQRTRHLEWAPNRMWCSRSTDSASTTAMATMRSTRSSTVT
ncbi:MAG: ABC transporter permease [Chloroflexi bacterium]|nr:MAG: ABC transporter permease [Chloroflexota bacterium]